MKDDKTNKINSLTPIERYVTQENGTERPYENEYWDFFEEGIYVDVVSSEPLFCSVHKFRASCGWPAFYQSIEVSNIVKVDDYSLGQHRVEVRSKNADSHLGHVFTDGPAPTGIRYCINSAALKFIPKSELEGHGLSKYLKYFLKAKESGCKNSSFLTLGAGCFWGVQAILAKTPGVINTISGYCGGDTIDPSYEDICTGKTGHAEVVQVEYNQEILSLENLLDLFFRLHDPTTLNAQGFDVGTQYRSAIFCHNDKDKEVSVNFISKLENEKIYSNKIVTEVHDFKTFYPAEEYHQMYYDKKYSGGQGPICHFVRGV